MIRAARPDDAPAIGRVQVETWRAAYRGIVWDATLAGLSPTERARQWCDFLADHGGARFVLVADDATDQLVGFAAAGPERSGDPTYRGELYAIYDSGRHDLDAPVGPRGERTDRTFYEALGGIVVRSKAIDIAGQTLTEVAYGWPDLRGY